MSGTDTASSAVSERIMTARDAMTEFENSSQGTVDDAVAAVAWAVCQDGACRTFAEHAVEETGMGNVSDKVEKTETIVRGALSDMAGARTVGVVNHDPTQGLTEIAEPVGVVGALTPSTNPVGTPVTLAMCAVKGRNAIVISPSPGAVETTEMIVQAIREQLDAVGAPPDLVSMVPPPITKPKAYELLDRVDLVQVTGSANNVEAGRTADTPDLCVGEGNVVCLVDESTAPAATADDIAHSASFDHGLTCLNANSLVANDGVRDQLIDALEARGGYLCTEAETDRVRGVLFADGELRSAAIGQSAGELASRADLPEAAAESSFLLVQPRGIGSDEPLCGEKLSPVVAVYDRPTFDEMLETTNAILRYEGKGHSCMVYTADRERVMTAGDRLDVHRIGRNQSSIELSGSFDNVVRFSFSLGGGPMGGSIVDENISYEHFFTTKKVVEPIDCDRPSDDDLFSDTRVRTE